MIDCIDSVCTAAKNTVALIKQVDQDLSAFDATAEQNQQDAAAKTQAYLNDVANAANVMNCVVTGPVGQICSGHVTVEEALARLNKISVSAMAADHLTALVGQTVFTLGAAVTNPAQLEVAINGSIQNNPVDYTVAGSTLTFVYGLYAGDLVDTVRFMV